mmetsp:Transcript_152695/g.489764  ORF Transcript_152695/g.489764 Transcript_152695/m.489764 type:complete len:428 (-) Transcript_152695:2157-3440(-)
MQVLRRPCRLGNHYLVLGRRRCLELHLPHGNITQPRRDVLPAMPRGFVVSGRHGPTEAGSGVFRGASHRCISRRLAVLHSPGMPGRRSGRMLQWGNGQDVPQMCRGRLLLGSLEQPMHFLCALRSLVALARLHGRGHRVDGRRVRCFIELGKPIWNVGTHGGWHRHVIDAASGPDVICIQRDGYPVGVSDQRCPQGYPSLPLRSADSPHRMLAGLELPARLHPSSDNPGDHLLHLLLGHEDLAALRLQRRGLAMLECNWHDQPGFLHRLPSSRHHPLPHNEAPKWQTHGPNCGRGRRGYPRALGAGGRCHALASGLQLRFLGLLDLRRLPDPRPPADAGPPRHQSHHVASLLVRPLQAGQVLLGRCAARSLPGLCSDPGHRRVAPWTGLVFGLCLRGLHSPTEPFLALPKPLAQLGRREHLHRPARI